MCLRIYEYLLDICWTLRIFKGTLSCGGPVACTRCLWLGLFSKELNISLKSENAMESSEHNPLPVEARSQAFANSSRKRIILFWPTDVRFIHVTCFGQWHISRCNASHVQAGVLGLCVSLTSVSLSLCSMNVMGLWQGLSLQPGS